MFFPNCSEVLKPVKNILSQDLNGGDYYTHHCSRCNTYWHLHLYGDSVDLISTRENPEINKAVKDGLLIELKKRVSALEK